ncbi:MAG: hypothetical protein WCO19_01765 [Candidatus Saccharibacteria bacterium]
MTNFEQLPQTMPAPMAEQLPPVGAELLAAPLELSEQIGHTAVQTELEITEATVAGRYDHLTTPMPADKDKLKQALGLSDSPDGDSYLESLAWQTEQDRPNARVAINMPVRVLPRFLKAGKYESAVESNVGTSPNRGISEVRRGYRTEEEPNLVYGYLTTKDASEVEKPDVLGYGGVQITLKPDAASRATFIAGDSMDMGASSGSLMNIDDALLIEETRRLGTQIGADKAFKPKYVEAQIHEGVSLNDIESISVPLDTTKQSVAESLQQTVEMLETIAPTVDKIIKIDLTEDIRGDELKIIETAIKYPGVKIELVVRQTDREFYDETQRTAPFIARNIGSGVPVETVDLAYQRMQERYTELSAKLPKIASEQLGIKELPSNLILVKGYNEGSQVARIESHDPYGKLIEPLAKPAIPTIESTRISRLPAGPIDKLSNDIL